MTVRIVAVMLLAAGLSACFSSEQPLVGPDQAVFPYETIVFASENGGDPQTLVHRGDAYIAEADGPELRMRFMPIGDGFYVAQAAGEDGDESVRLYGIVKLDTRAMKAMSFAVMAPGELVDQPGFSDCGDDMVCFANLDVYVDYARARIAAGADPDVIYTIISLD